MDQKETQMENFGPQIFGKIQFQGSFLIKNENQKHQETKL